MLAKSRVILGRKYRVIMPLGEGGMARVWLASELTFGGRLVAIKEPLVYLDTDQGREILRRFEQEIALSAVMVEAGVPNVVPAYTTERVDGVPLLVSRYMAGGSLAERLKGAGGKLSPAAAVAIVMRMLVALGHLHRLPGAPIHRDIKPSNILFDDNDQAFLADFGVAQVGGAEGHTRIAGLAHPVSMHYASPEQISSTKPLTPASDLYALGCVLYEILTGTRYDQQENPDLSSVLGGSEAGCLAPVLERALALDWRDRYQSADEMLTDLDRCREGGGAATALAPGSTIAVVGPVALGQTGDTQPDRPLSSGGDQRLAGFEARDGRIGRGAWWPYAAGAVGLLGIAALGWYALAMSRPDDQLAAVPTMTLRPTKDVVVAAASPQATPTHIDVPSLTPTPWPTDVPTATLPATTDEQAPAPIYQAEFGEAGTWDTGSGDGFRVFVADDALRMEFDAAHRTRWSNAHETFGDLVFGARACQVAGSHNNGYGLQFGHVDDDNFFYFMISGDGFYQFSKRVDGEWQGLIKWTRHESIHQGEACNVLMVEAADDLITLVVNGTMLAQVRDGSFSAGDIGLIAQSLDDPGVAVAFDAVVVFEP